MIAITHYLKFFHYIQQQSVALKSSFIKAGKFYRLFLSLCAKKAQKLETSVLLYLQALLVFA